MATLTMLPSTAWSMVPSRTPVTASPTCSLLRRSTRTSERTGRVWPKRGIARNRAVWRRTPGRRAQRRWTEDCLSSKYLRYGTGIDCGRTVFTAGHLEEDPMRFKTLTDHLIPLSHAAGLVAACSGAKPTPDAPAAKAEEKPAAVAESSNAAPANDDNAQGQAELDRAMEALRNVSVFFEFD